MPQPDIKKLPPLRKLSYSRTFGPGLITGASDDDPSGILTYLQAGVMLGLQTLWTALLTLPLMFGIQEMCGRIGFVTRRGLVALIKSRYSRPTLAFLTFISVAVIIINIGADLLAVGTVIEYLVGGSRMFWLPVIAALILFCTIYLSYRKFARILKWLSFSLVFYIITAFYINLDWKAALLATIKPNWDFSPDFIMLVAAILGTTISPYLFFWQANEEAEEKGLSDNPGRATKDELQVIRQDTFWGMAFSNIAAWFIIAGASQLSAQYGITSIVSFEQAALVLTPILGKFAYLVFALGIVGTGLLAIPVLAGSIGYTLSEIFGWREGINKPFHRARGFYLSIAGATVLGMLLTMLGFDPVQLLIYTAVLYALITPILIFFIIRLGNDRKLMGEYKNPWWSNLLAWLTLVFTACATLAYLWTKLFQG
ncbi:MAG TPA: divalent metal cation transporter [Candidatus Paceibacterota bacterium]